MTGQRDAPELAGELRTVPFAGDALRDHTIEAFDDLADRPAVDSVLVLTRSAHLVETVRDWLANRSDGMGVHSTVQSLTQHAARVRTTDTARRRVATRAQQLTTIAALANDHDWDDTPFLQRASQQDSFLADLSMLVTSILTQDIQSDAVSDDDLRAVVEFAHNVKARLERAGLIDLSRVIHAANRSLETGGDLSLPDAVLVVNFEEFTPREREYVARISNNRPLVCVAQEHASVYRIGEEPGAISQITGLTHRDESTPSAPQTRPEVVARRLVTGETDADIADPDRGTVVRLHNETLQANLRAMADEIHRLHNTEQGDDATISYSDIAVAVRDTRAPLADVIQTLWNQHVPVTSTTGHGLEHDTAARELYQVLQAVVAYQHDSAIPSDAIAVLVSRLQGSLTAPVSDRSVRDQIKAAADHDRFDEALSHWIRTTQLKSRIAQEHDTIQARIAFQHVSEIVELVAYIDANDLYTTPDEFLELIAVFYEQHTGDRLADDLATSETGTRVDTIRSLKGDRHEVVFVVGVVEDEFPSDLPTNPLFPERRARNIDQFPLLVQPDAGDVQATFPTAGADCYDPLRAYYRELDRRLLGVAAQTARRHLYLGTYQQDRGGLTQYRPSRYLDVIAGDVAVDTRSGETTTHTPGHQIVQTFDESRREIRAAAAGKPLDIEELYSRFETVQELLEAQADDRVRDALRTRIDLANGHVRRRSPATTDTEHTHE